MTEKQENIMAAVVGFLIAWAITFGIMYLVGAFIFWNWNYADSTELRFMVMISLLMCAWKLSSMVEKKQKGLGVE